MKFRKFGKALLMSALSVGAVLGVTSCVQSYTVGFLYVTETVTSGSTGQGQIDGFKIDHNTGNLVTIHGMPVASGGAFPGRAVLVNSRFVYVLNRGVDQATQGACTATTTNCKGANVTLFAVGGNGILSAQPVQFFPVSTTGNPFRIIADAQGNYLYLLDGFAPSSSSCALALGAGVTACGAIEAYKIDQITGRLTLLQNAQVSSATGTVLPYFPVPANPIDFVLTSSFILTLSGTPGTTNGTGDEVFPYAYNQSSGQLTISQNSAQPISAGHGTAIVTANGDVYVLDNEPITIVAGSGSLFNAGTYAGQILPFTVGTGGALQAQTGGIVPTDANQTNPIVMVAESKGKWVYLANQGDLTSSLNAVSGIVGYDVDPSTKQLRPMPNSPFGSGSGPQCLLEDPSDQFIYNANYNDSTVYGSTLDQNLGPLKTLPAKNKSFKLQGPAAWCLVTGRTS